MRRCITLIVLSTLGMGSTVSSGHGDDMVVCSATEHQYGPSIVSDDMGGAYVVWSDLRNGARAYYAQRIARSGVQWTSDGLPVSTPNNGAEAPPSVSTDGLGGLLVAWSEITNGQRLMFTRRLAPSGNTVWMAQYPGGPAPTAAHNGAGGALMMWHDYTPSWFADVYARTVNETGYASLNRVICSASGDQFWPKALPDGLGGAFVTWDDVGGFIVTFVQHVNASAFPMWGNGISISPTQTQDGPARMVVDDQHHLILAWPDTRNEPWGPSDVFVQRMGTSSASWDSNGVAVCTAMGSQTGPSVVSDGTGGAIVAWHDPRSGASRLFAQRVDVTGTTQWLTDGIPLCGECVLRSMPEIVSDGTGGAIVTWSDQRGGDVYAQKVTAAGQLAWGPEGVRVSSAPGGQNEPKIAPDGSGGAILVWTDGRDSADLDIYAGFIDSDGTVTRVASVDKDRHTSQGIDVRVSPNPLRTSSSIVIRLSQPAMVGVHMTDLSGRIVLRRAEQEMASGLTTVQWNGQDSHGRRLPAGMYFVVATTRESSTTTRVALVR